MKPVPAAGIVGLEALREAATSELNQIIGLVRAALQARYDAATKTAAPYSAWFDIEALFPDRVIVAKDGRYWQFGYAIDAANQVKLEEPVEVIEQFTPVAMRESLDAGAWFVEASADGKVWDVVIVRAGASKNGVFYPDAVLREAVSLFEGAKVYVKSNEVHLKGERPDIGKLAGWISDVKFVEGRQTDTGELRGRLNIAGKAELRETLADAWKRGKRDLVGLSIDALGKARNAAHSMREGVKKIAQSITKVLSVDLIVDPSAGGALVRLVEAADSKEPDPMKQRLLEAIKTKRPDLFAKINPETITDEELESRYAEALAPAPRPGNGNEPVTREELRMVEARASARTKIAASTLPQPAKEKLQARFDGLSRFTEADVDAEIKAEREYLARFAESGRVQLGGLDIQVEDRPKKIAEMFDAFFDPQHKEHRNARSFRECYIELTGDRRVTGRLENCDRTRMAESIGAAFRESLDSASWGNVLGNAITRRLVADYRRPSQYDIWRQIVGLANVNDFRTNERTRFGGYGDLPAVAQSAAYLALASPTDEKATYAVTKRGGTEDITLEMIKNDDVGAIRQVPIKLSRSAKRTLAKFVLDFIRTNPTIYDSVAFFHATHNNLGSLALDATQLAAARLRMLKQTEADSADRLGIGPKFLLVPADLQETAVNLFNRNTNLDKTFVQVMSLEILPVWYWTDLNDWAIGADPMDLPSIEIGFLDGNEEPELFVQDNPTVGSMFTNDKVTYKVRHIYGGNVTNFRGFDKSVVA